MKRKELVRKLGIVLISGAMMLGSPATSMVYAGDNTSAATSGSESGTPSASDQSAPATQTPVADGTTNTKDTGGNTGADGAGGNTSAEGATSSSSTPASENKDSSEGDKKDAPKEDATKKDTAKEDTKGCTTTEESKQKEDATPTDDKSQKDSHQEEAAEGSIRTIHLLMEDGTDAKVSVDGVDGETTDHIDEKAKDGKFESVKIPALEGYSAYIDGKKADSVTSADDTSSAVKDIYVVYAKADASVAKVSVTKNGDEVVSITAVGKKGDKYPAYTNKIIHDAMDGLKKEGYIASVDYSADDYTFEADGSKNIVVAMTPYEEEITSNNPKTEDEMMTSGKKYPAGLEKKDLEQTWTRTIHYIKADDTENDNTDNKEAAESVTQTVTKNRTATVNHVNGDVTYGDWKITSNDKEFAEAESPEIAGYTADKLTIDKEEITDDTKKSEDVYVTYTADDQKAVIKFVDKDGNAIAKDVTLTGKSGEIMGVTDKDGKTSLTDKDGKTSLYSTKEAIKTLTDKGYKFVKDEFPTTEKDGVFDLDKKTNQVYKVVLEPVIETVTSAAPKDADTQMNANGDKYPEGLSKKDLEKTVTRTIHFVDKNRKKLKDDVVQTVTFTREAVVNHVTRKVTYGDWTSNNQSFALVEAPAIDGYKTNVKAVDTVTVKPTDEDSEETVVYTAASEGNSTDTTGKSNGTASGSGAGISQSGKTQTGDTPVVPYAAGAGAAIAALFATLKKKKAPKEKASKN